MSLIEQANKIVIKVGSSFLVNPRNGEIRKEWIDNFVEDICNLVAKGKKVTIVTSGSIAMGSYILRVDPNKLKLQEKQNVSVVGQYYLMEIYRNSFARFKKLIAQALITIEDVENRKRVLSIRNTMDFLLDKSIIPIVNENDLIANTEIRFGDNDRLSARVAQIIEADLLIMLSLVDGLYTADPRIDSDAKFITEVYNLAHDVEVMATDSKGKTGGMSAKLISVKLAMNAGCNVIITNGNSDHPIRKLEEGGRCSKFIVGLDASQKYKIG